MNAQSAARRVTNFTGSKIERTRAACKAKYGEVFCNQLSVQEQKEFKQTHLEEIEKVIGSDGVWFNTEVLIAVGNK